MKPKQTQRERTEIRLEDAALSFLKTEGLLAGLNLRAVADEAGMNRGLVYHYFGSRRELLRSALRRRVNQSMSAMPSGPVGTWEQQVNRQFRFLVENQDVVRLLTALILDGDEETRLMPFRDGALQGFRQRQSDGEIPQDLDLEALQIVGVCLTYGFAMFQEVLARESKIDDAELADRVEAVITRVLGSLAATEAPSG